MLFDDNLPPRRCPACGGRFVVSCRPAEWGYAWGTKLCCSYGCMREMQRRHPPRIIDGDRRRTAYLMRLDGVSISEITRRLGYKSTHSCEWAIDYYARNGDLADVPLEGAP